MKKILALVFVLTLFTPDFVFAQHSSKVKKGSPKSWIETIHYKEAAPDKGQEASYYYLLIDEQENIPEKEYFIHYAYKILTNEGLQQMSDLSIDFDPSYEQLTLHKVEIHRDGKVISALTDDVRTVQREESMDRYLYDGSVTAIINIKDVRVGDIVEYAYTRKGYNPVYGNHISRRIDFNYSMAYEESFQRIIVPAELELVLKYVNADNEPAIEKKEGLTYYTWKLNRTKGLDYDSHVPDWYNPYSFVLTTSFKNWGEVAQWAVERYQISEHDKETVLNKMSPAFNGTTKEEYALQVIRFVQDEIRYLGFESGLNSHKPHAPSMVYEQRFGDCKDKSLLLSALLNAKGIESYPVLLNTTYRDKIVDRLPSTNAFDHCVVQVKLKDKIFYIDPTVSGQGGTLDDYYFPDYGKGLVVSKATTDLIDFPDPVSSSVSEVQNVNMETIGGEATLTITTTYTGAEAEGQRSYFSRDNIESIQKGYLTYYGNLYSDIKVKETVQTEDDRTKNIFIVKEKYTIPDFWKPINKDGSDEKIYSEVYPLTLESFFSVSTKSGSRTAPYRLQYPVNYSHEINIDLPEEWDAPSSEEEIESEYYEYHYSTSYRDKRITILTDYKTLRESIPTEHFQKFVDDHGRMMSNLNYKLTYDPKAVKAVSNKWPGVLLSIAALLGGAVLVFWLYRSFNPQPYYPSEWGQPIGGWLVLVGIGLVLTPIRLLYDLATVDHMLDGTGWLAMLYSENYGVFSYLIIAHVYNIIFLLFAALMIVLFFQRRSSVPVLILFFYGISGTMAILDSILSAHIDPSAPFDTKSVAQAIFSCAVWIPYFRMSNRVKKTFVNINNDREGLMPIAAEI